MSTFSSILSSIGNKPGGSQQASNAQDSNTSRPAFNRGNTASDDRRRATGATVAGIKRKSEEPEPQSQERPKIARLGGGNDPKRSAALAPSSRFQLSTKPAAAPQASRPTSGSSSSPAISSSTQRPTLKPSAQRGAGTTTSHAAPPAKRGFASIMEKAKAAQEAAKASAPSGIHHKAAGKLTKRERRRIMEAAKAEQEARKRKGVSRGSPGNIATQQRDSSKKESETGYKGTMRKPPAPLAYKGTMHTASAGETAKKKHKGEAQDKYGGYASWSDLDDAEDDEEEEEEYDSEASSDMEGGFDDVEREELLATRAARKEDQEALEEEERHRKEKMERKRKLMQLSQNAKARKKF